MAKRGRKYREAIEAYDKREARNFEEAITLLKSFPKRGFDESVELSFNLGIDGRQADQTLRGTVMLPHGTGKEVRVVVVPGRSRNRCCRGWCRSCGRCRYHRENPGRLVGFRSGYRIS